MDINVWVTTAKCLIAGLAVVAAGLLLWALHLRDCLAAAEAVMAELERSK